MSRSSSGKRGPQRAQRLLDDPVGDPRARALVVLLLRDPEQDHRLDAGAEQLLALAHDPVDGVPRHRRQRLVRSASGATKSGITRSSSESVVSRTRSRSAPVRRRRRSRVAGKVLTAERVRRSARRRRSAAGDVLGLVGSTGSTSTGIAPPPAHGSNVTRSAKNSHDRAADREQRQRDQRADQAVDVRAGEQAEDHEQRVQPQRAPHHLRHDDVALDLVDAEEEQHDPDRPRTGGRRARRSPAGSRRATGRGRAAPRSAPPSAPNSSA